MHLSTLLIAASSIYNAVPCLATSQDTLAPPPPTKPRYTFDDLWKLEKKFWDNFLYPANLKQTQGNESTVFTKDVQGRVDITRTFDGDELNREYIFGLFSDPNHVSLVGVPIDYSITQFAANDNIASATTVVTFNATTFGILLPVTIDTWIAFNEDGKIEQYDATFRWFEYLLDLILDSVGKKINATSPTQTVAYMSDLLAKTICATHEASCTGANQQYNSTEACYKYLTESVRFGKSYELGRNTLLCREVHEHMVPYRPDVHCSHIGPSGGSYCVDDTSYSQTVLAKYFNESWIPFGYGKDQNVWLA
ncbi:hypothetical protein POX_g08647 [Penicillium oxalicum]|uniref:Uncharacterized protein n=1 Tax=Penicillium oxalicum (strain 114-2 / CGMCC 5302) TaxID=933388 RepID=S7ZA16_PENO1|nr:hypothetical protein POX_g08647 [Penicillium oxalicum]EPS27054.1 hypothetical protein PDE_01995 [Penicillium oxalicum 114-2]KAI2786264.1 hypothetical protein POX_g08647 [Penicillium oxalicum]